MSFRFRRSIRITKGLRLNVSKSGFSMSVGGRGSTMNIGKRGVRATAGIPGTGLSWSQSLTKTSTVPGARGSSPTAILNAVCRQDPNVAEVIEPLRTLIAQCLPSIRKDGNTSGWPVMICVGICKDHAMGGSSLGLRKGDRTALDPDEEFIAEARVDQQDKKDDVVLKLIKGVAQARESQQQKPPQAQTARPVQSVESIRKPATPTQPLSEETSTAIAVGCLAVAGVIVFLAVLAAVLK